MKRVLFAIGIMGNGGAERVIAALANRWNAEGIEVGILTIYGTRQDYALSEGIHHFPIVCKNKIRLLRPMERIGAIRRAVKEFAPDCVVSFLADVNIHVICACRGLGIPLVVSERNDPTRDPSKAWVRRMRDRLYRKAAGVVFQTEDAAGYFAGLLPKTVPTAIIPNPLTEGLPYHVYEPECRRLVTACRLNSQKNLPMMIMAVKAAREKGADCVLDIFGEGPLRGELEALIEREGLTGSVRLPGFSKSVHEEMAHSAAFLISSDYEGISNSMLEALAIGTPVVATDCPVGGARMYIRTGENGYLIPVGDTAAMTEAILALLSDPERAEEMGRRATEIREELRVDRIVSRWSEFLAGVLEAKA